MSDPLRVCVEFDPGDDPIAGSLSSEGAQRRFTGWLGLITALQSALVSRQAEPSRDGDPGGGVPRGTGPVADAAFPAPPPAQ